MDIYASAGLSIIGNEPIDIRVAEQGLIIQRASISLDDNMIRKIEHACLISSTFEQALKRVAADLTTPPQVKDIIRNTLSAVCTGGLQIDGEYFKQYVGQLAVVRNTLATLPSWQRRLLFDSFCVECAADSMNCDCWMADEGEK